MSAPHDVNMGAPRQLEAQFKAVALSSVTVNYWPCKSKPGEHEDSLGMTRFGA